MHLIADKERGAWCWNYGGSAKLTALQSDNLSFDLPLTPGQLELIELIESGTLQSHTSFEIPLPENTVHSLDLIRHAWTAVASHNPILRSIIYNRSNEYFLKVSRAISSVRFQDGDLKSTADPNIPASLVVALKANELAARIRTHRALIDDASVRIIREDFDSFFKGIAFDVHANLVSFVRSISSRDQNAAKLFWQTKAPNITTAPIHGFPAEPTDLSSTTTASLPADRMRGVFELAALQRVPVRAVFYAAWAATLSTHTEAASNVVMFAVSSRDESTSEQGSLVGPAELTYPILVKAEPNLGLSDMLQEIAANDQRAASQAFLGYNSISEQCPKPEGSTLLIVREGSVRGTQDIQNPYLSHFSVLLTVDIDTEARLTLRHSNIVEEADARVVLDHFSSVLESLVRQPSGFVRDLTLVSEKERAYLLELGRPLTTPVDGLVHTLFERQVVKTPDQPALQFENEAGLSYNQLNCLANGVARQLNCGRGDYVPVCIRRSTNLILALCAILKAGAGYVTTDPDVPSNRNNFIFEDVGAKFAIVDRWSKGTFPNEILIEDLSQASGQYKQTNLDVQQTSDDIAYVIYTSGSTGNPKGVLLEHRNAFSGLAAFPFIPDLRQLLFHNPVFSAAQRSIWSTLKQGGCLCLASKENLTVHIGRTINEMKINTIDVTPSTSSLITPGSVPNLKRMTVAGELINPALVPQWVDKLELMNAYGLSENTQFNWRHVIERNQNPQNIGRPIDTTTAYVLKPDTTELSPLLVPGELCLGGYQLARGYLNRPEKTAAAFISNPFGAGRLYRTGDLVVTHADGSIEMIGRTDFSIKINDQRVDPGESNSIIQLHPQVHDSAVVAASINNRMVLVAAIVHAETSVVNDTLKDIKLRLEKQLPGYMIPSYWTARNELPLNINGKVDVPALRNLCEEMGREGLMAHPKPSTEPSESPEVLSSEDKVSEVEHNLAVPPLTTQEKIVLNSFADSLAISPSQISLDDTFDSLGGSSLEAIKAVSLALESGLKLSVSVVLMDETVRQLARDSEFAPSIAIDTTADPSNFELAPPGFVIIDPDNVECVMPATPLQVGIIAESIFGQTNYMLYRLYSLQGITADQVHVALQQVVDNRPMLRTKFVAHKDTFLQIIQKRIAVPFERFSGSVASFTEQQRDVTEFSDFDASLIRLVELDKDIVAIETHHVLVDSWSYHFIQDDIRSVLRSDALRPRAPFKNYIQYLQTKNFSSSQKFWQEYLRGSSSTRLEIKEVGAFSRSIKLAQGGLETNKLESASMAATLYTVWAIVLSAFTGSNDVTFFVNVSGRESPVQDILDIQGPTISTVPIRVDVDSSQTLNSLAQKISVDFWTVSEHAYVGLMNILKVAETEGTLANTSVNYLLSREEVTSPAGLESMEVNYPSINDLVTIQLDSKQPGIIHFYSSHSLIEQESIFAATKLLFEAAVREPNTTVESLITRINTAARRSLCLDAPVADFTAASPVSSSHSESTVQSWESVDPALNSSGNITPFDEITPESERDVNPMSRSGSKHGIVLRSENIVSEAGSISWKVFLEGSSPTLLQTRPLPKRTEVTSLMPLVKVRAAATRAQTSIESLFTATFGVVLGQHTQVEPVFAIAASETGEYYFKASVPEYLTPRRMALPDNKLVRDIASLISLTDREQRENNFRPVAISEAMKLGYGTLFDCVIVFKSDLPTTIKQMRPIQHCDDYLSSFAILEITEGSKQVRLRLSGSIEEGRARYILDQLSATVQSLISRPGGSLCNLDLVGVPERAHLRELAKSRTPEFALIHKYFEDWVEKTPQAVALALENGQNVTYRELNERANRLSRHLIELGVSPKSMVPLYFDKSAEMIVAILAVLKAGAAYVPLSPENPNGRNLFVMKEVKAPLIVSTSQFKPFALVHSLRTAYADQSDHLHHYDASNPDFGDINNAAYVLFTSGSTGSPKGVEVTHRAISASVQGHLKVTKTDSTTRNLLFANYTFDVSVHDIFATLGVGATLCLAPTQQLASNLTGLINELRATQTFVTPTVARLLTPDQVPTMKKLLCGGEALTTDIIDAWSKNCTLINFYGPTETAVDVTYNLVDHETKSTSIGYPIETCSIMVVKPDKIELSPLGAIGELCVAGPHLANGYLNREDLTSKVFVPSPIVEHQRMYRTGDLARWLPDGTLEYLGRIDHQIKLNGLRIELGEIEQVILQSKFAEECIAMVLDKLTRPKLAVFCVIEPSSEAGIQPPMSTEKLEEFQRSITTLAHYMIPQYVFPVGLVPRMSSSNKANRKALKALAEQLTQLELAPFSLAATAREVQTGPPETISTEEEVALQSIWADIFSISISSIDANSNLALLGGDSISAINIVSACRRLGYKISVDVVLKSKTLRDTAQQLRKSVLDSNQVAPVQCYKPPAIIFDLLEERGFEEQDIEYVYPCPPGQSEFLSHGNSKQQIWTVTATWPLRHRVEEVHSLLVQLTTINDILRTTFTKILGRGWIAAVLKEPVVHMTTRRCEGEDDRERIIAEIRRRRFIFGEPFVRYIVLKYPDGSQDIVIKMDHGLWDGTSLRIFDEVTLALQTLTKEVPQNTQFKDFVFDAWRREKRPSLDFWRNVVTDGETVIQQASASLSMQPSTQMPCADHVFSHPVSPLLPINELARACGVTPASLFQGIFQLWQAHAGVAMQHHQMGTKIEDSKPAIASHASFDYLHTGRNVDLPNPQSINGCCANFLPFRIPIPSSSTSHSAPATLSNFLKASQDFFWSATQHDNVGLDEIYAHAGQDRSRAGNRMCFLFQPFDAPVTESTAEPPGLPVNAIASTATKAEEDGGAQNERKEKMRWVVLALSKSHMQQPYALQQEIHKLRDEGQYKMLIRYDGREYDEERVRTFAMVQEDMLRRACERMLGARGSGGEEVMVSELLEV